MAVRFYIVPKAGSGATPSDAVRPKYVADSGVPFSCVDFGREDAVLVAADVSDAQHASLTSNSDLTAVPADLDSTVGANLGTVQARLEALNIPAGWLTSGTTYRQALRAVVKMFLLFQRLRGLGLARLFTGGVTLSTTLNQLSQAQQDGLRQAAEQLGADTSGVSGATTLRQALKLLADQLPGVTLMGGPL